jgi:hypothetical protein
MWSIKSLMMSGTFLNSPTCLRNYYKIKQKTLGQGSLVPKSLHILFDVLKQLQSQNWNFAFIDWTNLLSWSYHHCPWYIFPIVIPLMSLKPNRKPWILLPTNWGQFVQFMCTWLQITWTPLAKTSLTRGCHQKVVLYTFECGSNSM